jgi:hypothetical protein
VDKEASYQAEFDKWNELFQETTPATQKAAAGLIKIAANFQALCWELEQALSVSGAIRIHLDNPKLQKSVPALKEYARLCEAYSNIVNKLNGLRMKNVVEEDDELKEFE